MTIIRLEGSEKEKYIKNLINTTNILIKSIKNGEFNKKYEWDLEVYKQVTRILENYILPFFRFLQYTKDEEDYKNNFGFYREIVLSNGGLPEFFSYRQLLEDKTLADERIKQLLESEDINSKEDLVKKWIDRANNDTLSNKEERRNYLLEIIPEKFQTIEFYEKIKKTEFLNIKDPMKKLYIKPLKSEIAKVNGKEKERYLISWFNYITGFGVWNIYVMQLQEVDPEHKKNYNIFKKDNIPSKGHFVPQEKSIYIDSDFKKFLEDHMSSGAFFLARDIDKTFATIFPERISRFQFGPNFMKGISSGSLDFSWLFVENPDAFFLTAVREDIQSYNDNRDIKERDRKEDNNIYIDKIIGTKCSWRVDRIIEQRFGICSKELEKALKEYIKFPDMRLYAI